ncbi:MAG: hypothetical protein FWE45_02240 [Firmicutes bacterium]|nr:hypothetical protein [Bacillota bacterium]
METKDEFIFNCGSTDDFNEWTYAINNMHAFISLPTTPEKQGLSLKRKFILLQDIEMFAEDEDFMDEYEPDEEYEYDAEDDFDDEYDCDETEDNLEPKSKPALDYIKEINHDIMMREFGSRDQAQGIEVFLDDQEMTYQNRFKDTGKELLRIDDEVGLSNNISGELWTSDGMEPETECSSDVRAITYCGIPPYHMDKRKQFVNEKNEQVKLLIDMVADDQKQKEQENRERSWWQ